MARRAPSPRRFTTRSRSNLEWSDFSDVETNVSGPSVKALLAVLVHDPALDITVLRVRMALYIVTDQIVSGEIQAGAIGAISVTSDATAAGAASVPGPVSDPGADWFMYQPFTQKFLFSTAVAFTPNAANQIMVDSKAKRIIGPSQRIAIVCESNSDSEGFNVMFQGRLLSKVTGTR